ncbi:peptidyl-prolyl cis-trans isomerase [Longilinea arvoryzae]|uniref:peptidylprolyl isomerase n=1 Tax=Longilinea arvoryzae TaxID=360412 RepID=A0A0S7BDY0_9CHLR|nr:peptidylprolyl isomerase [Longilinea arvoryzae]GAP13088.1 peptidyl-prolyl cis-trans isomerase [Longilinea arvoryzae]
MKRTYWISVLMLVAVALSACGAQATPAATATVTTAPSQAATETGASITPTPTEVVDCKVESLFIDQTDKNTNLPPVSDQDWKIGADGAKVVLIEYSDFQCPYCQQSSDGLKKFVEDHAGEVQLVYRPFPLPSHDKSLISAQAAEAAGLQGKFWEMHAILFKTATWETWTSMSVDDFKTWIVDQAKTIDGLNVDQFSKDLVSDAIVKKVADEQAAANTLQIPGTPSLYILIDGKVYFTPADQVPTDASTLQLILDLWGFKDKQYTACPPTVIDASKSYTATLDTTKGKIVIELYPDKAPLAVNSFVFLARDGWFNNIPWHRVVADFVAQSGDPSGTGAGGPGYLFKNETNDLKFDAAGMVGMANSGANRNGSQFFITLAAAPNLDGSYTVFGKVIEGLDVVKSLTLRDPQNDAVLADPDMINSVTIEEK